MYCNIIAEVFISKRLRGKMWKRLIFSRIIPHGSQFTANLKPKSNKMPPLSQKPRHFSKNHSRSERIPLSHLETNAALPETELHYQRKSARPLQYRRRRLLHLHAHPHIRTEFRFPQASPSQRFLRRSRLLPLHLK